MVTQRAFLWNSTENISNHASFAGVRFSVLRAPFNTEVFSTACRRVWSGWTWPPQPQRGVGTHERGDVSEGCSGPSLVAKSCLARHAQLEPLSVPFSVALVTVRELELDVPRRADASSGACALASTLKGGFGAGGLEPHL